MTNGNFWLGLLMLVGMIVVKDVLYAGLTRMNFFQPEDIIQEVCTLFSTFYYLFCFDVRAYMNLFIKPNVKC